MLQGFSSIKDRKQIYSEKNDQLRDGAHFACFVSKLCIEKVSF
ncbi:hypothetical protein VII00023_06087 [Vibrio ichthyoenteri ATCC 700023]|uniref:Uncharacterized protein n=1 Tax=Vibrio ichthyoenteri ATCC 700023 TaxID=870968 RepID=F9S2V3_9VIBR|nr:hypothetical protein VII00023_06087 [Vibrio ichthyoenteri ATCC 700023]